MLGVPVKDHERFKSGASTSRAGLDAIMLPPDSEVGKRSITGRRALAEYFRELIAERRAAPREDMLSALIAAEEAGDKLNEEELLATCILLLVAGPRDHREPDRQRHAGAPAPPRPAPPPPRGSRAHRQRGRGAAALRRAGAAHRAHPERGHHDRRADHPQGRDGDAVPGRGRPRPRPVPGSGPPRHHARRQPAHRLRHGHPLLPGRPARAHGGPDRDQHAARDGCRSWPWPASSPSTGRASRCGGSCRCRSRSERARARPRRGPPPGRARARPRVGSGGAAVAHAAVGASWPRGWSTWRAGSSIPGASRSCPTGACS